MKKEKNLKKVFNQLLFTLLIVPFIVLTVGWYNKAMGEQQQQNIIKSISPESATTGETITLSIQLDESLGSPPIPPSNVMPELVKIGDIEATSIQRSNFVITAAFSIPGTAYPGQIDVSVQFGAPPDQPISDPLIFTKSNAFEILSNSAPGSLIVNIKPDTASSEGAMWKIDNGSWQNSGVTASELTIGVYKVYFSSINGWNTPSSQNVTISSNQTSTLEVTYEKLGEQTLSYPIVDTNQSECFDSNGSTSSCDNGQDGLYKGFSPNYTDNGDGTITDNITGLMWQQDPGDKVIFEDAVNNASSFSLAGYNDWRLPTIKELYSLILFSGRDISGYDGTDTSQMTPFINNNYFNFEYGDTTTGERLIDSQYASSTEYVSTTMNGNHTVFGVNFADGRIKGYGTEPNPNQTEGKTFFVIYVRGNSSYGKNLFKDNGDATITDNATGLMWTQDDSQKGLLWEVALDYCEDMTTAGHNDWRLPNVKELQSIVDYSRSPDTTQSAAIDPVFNSTSISNEENQNDYPYYWSSTTHANMTNGANSSYVSFGRAMGNMEGNWMDVHGAGAQRSDPKTGDPNNYPDGHGPQGDAIRIYNYVRCVRDADVTSETNTGSLIVNISPQEAVEDNLQWKVDDGDWQNSGDTVIDLSVGNHIVSFKSNENWIPLEDKTVTITDGKTTTINVTFISNSSSETCIPGDLDSNGKINLKDVIILLQKCINM